MVRTIKQSNRTTIIGDRYVTLRSYGAALDCCKSRGCKHGGLISCRGCVEYYKGICLKGLEPNVHLIELLLNTDKNQIY